MNERVVVTVVTRSLICHSIKTNVTFSECLLESKCIVIKFSKLFLVW